MNTSLTNKKIDGARPKDRLYKLYDADGLYIAITPSGVKSWRRNYAELVDGETKHRTKTLGRYPEISVAAARKLNREHKEFIASGGGSGSTFDDVKKKWLLRKLQTLKNAKHKLQIVNRLDKYVSPVIGKMQIEAIRRVNLVDVVQRVADTGKLETAQRVGMHMRQIFDYAVDLGLIESHAAAGLSRVIDTPVTKPMACVAVDDAGKLLRAIAGFESPITRIGLLLAVHTFVRSGELRFMQRSEIKDGRFWVIPETRTKGRKGKRKPHVVPLSDSVLKLLAEADNITGDYDYVLLSSYGRDKPISENAMLDALYSLGYRHKQTVHGFRALASTVLNEQSPFESVVIERQLAHKERDEVKAAYDRAEHLGKRVELMTWWSNWVDTALSSG